MLMVLEQCSVEQAAALIRNAASSEAQTLVVVDVELSQRCRAVAWSNRSPTALWIPISRELYKDRRRCEWVVRWRRGNRHCTPQACVVSDAASALDHVGQPEKDQAGDGRRGRKPVGRRRSRGDGRGRLPAGLSRRPRRR